jgi:bacterioferritin-associated ferredoxin
LEYLEIEAFCFAQRHGLQLSKRRYHTEIALIVCSCNVLSDDDVRSAVSAAGGMPRTARQVYGCLGCSAECGRCARTINKIIKDALGACAKECAAGCPHTAHQVEAMTAGLPLNRVSA